MSIITESMDYNNALVTWKLPLKKSFDVKTMEIQEQSINSHNNIPPLITIPSSIPSHGDALQVMHLGQFELMPSQHIHTNISQHNMQSQSTVHHLDNKIVENKAHICQNIHIISPVNQQKEPPKSKKLDKPKDKLAKKKVKMKKVPVGDMAYHSKQFGLKVPPKKTLGIKGLVISRQTREVIHNVYKFMKDEAQNGTKIPLANYRERVLAATGISKCTYSKITSKECINGILLDTIIPRRRKIGIHIEQSVTDGEVTENDSIYRPKINREASTRDGVYNLEDLVPTHILATLENDAIAVISGSGQEGLTQFVSYSIHQILNSGISQEMMVRKITIFLYINYLITFINTPIKMITKKYALCSSMEVNNHILDNFSVRSSTRGRTRPVYMKDKSLCFLVVLAALALDYEVDLSSLSKDCKIGVKKALEISRILAFNASGKNKNVVTLNLPLPAPITFSLKKKIK